MFITSLHLYITPVHFICHRLFFYGRKTSEERRTDNETKDYVHVTILDRRRVCADGTTGYCISSYQESHCLYGENSLVIICLIKKTKRLNEAREKRIESINNRINLWRPNHFFGKSFFIDSFSVENTDML